MNQPLIFNFLTSQAWINSLYSFSNKVEIYLVGGYIRDMLMGKEGHDIDLLITNISHEDIQEKIKEFGHLVETNGHFKTIKFRPFNWDSKYEDIDIVIPRIDVTMSDEEFKIAKEKDPALNKHQAFKIIWDMNLDAKHDLIRRDFTINSMAVDIKTHELIDPFNAQKDLYNGRIKMTNADTFKDDPVRMLRAFRFACRYNFVIEADTLNEIIANKELIAGISPERILMEFKKSFEQINTDPLLKKYIKLIQQTKILDELISRDEELISDSYKCYMLNRPITSFAWFVYLILGTHNYVISPSVSYSEILKGDKETELEIDTIDKINKFIIDKSREDNDYVYRKLAFYVYNKCKACTNYFFNDKINNAFREIISSNFIKSTKDLALDGEEIKKLLGINDSNLKMRAKEIGEMQRKLIDLILQNIAKNTKESLTYFIKTL